jgi:hypothetical protein
MDRSCLDDSGIRVEEERAGEGPGPTGRGLEQEDRHIARQSVCEKL